ncbi:DUF2851 family protein [Subsaximicrobium wynnwilliamsii]|uniref:DUF2851 family protein n=1 Tax=Subsaximicrobium wynnwilliamsii TaxID=291179 RepID=A0A5C6ZG10_9FLAO|nr:DUF2851 family protein [Subsaximicrobium wynnwilliamsii]TXD81751.1 DUF2851 family protein [Subsaximicrobium wynnwilliamsii]TXD87577.1 DUF2851 family protein [Subsaximicrobium wynnwilliamsii]TXE01250.1 DUF2851 family protein [Subsaximicrobium wynnwilliamsii]
MQEDFLHYVWKHKKIDVLNLKTSKQQPIRIVSVGRHNYNSGPDFFNAQLSIGDQLWAGNVEIHIKSSDWYAHHHEQDVAYDNVILHVVYEHDSDIFRKDNSEIPTLELKQVINQGVFENYKRLFSAKHQWINCETDFAAVDDFIISNWLQRLYFERLEVKANRVEALLTASKNDWEAVLFKLLAKSFGLKVNGEAFLSMASSMDFSVIRKTQNKQMALEALFFGQAGLLEHATDVSYQVALQKEYEFLKQKFQLENSHVMPFQFFRLRPPNFPTIRLSQLAMLYHKEQHLLSELIAAKSMADFYELFEVTTSEFWKSHYTFSKCSKASAKKLTKAFVDLLVINTILPIKFSYARHKGQSVVQEISELISEIEAEKNSISKGFNSLKVVASSAMDSQALIQLKTNYCDTNQCLRCAIGNSLLGK